MTERAPTLDRSTYQVPAVHIWCSRDHRTVKAADCDMCKRFHAAYPMDEDIIAMAKKHFPDAIPRT